MQEQYFTPIYQRLFEHYKQAIFSMKYRPGQQLDSINKIMLTHSVSRDTAKQVLKMLADAGLIVKQVGKGSFVTHGAQTKPIWGVVLPFLSSNLEELITHLNEEGKRRGFKIDCCLHFNNTDKEIASVGKIIRDGYNAVIVVPNFDERKTIEFYKNLISGNTQVVLADYTMTSSKLKYVIQSYALGIKRAVSYLINKTDKNLLLIQNENWTGKNSLNELLSQSFSSYTAEACKNREVFTIDQTRDLNIELLKENSIGGILCTADVDAIKTYSRISSWGIKIPENISLICYGKTELLEHFKPKITAIDCCYKDMAQCIATIIENKKDSKKQFVFPPKLEEGET